VTYGDSTSTLDPASTAFFTTFCSDAAAAIAVAAPLTKTTTTASAAPLLTSVATSFATMSTDLAALPVPGFAGGDQYASAQIKAATERSAKATALAAIAASGDAAKLTAAMPSMGEGPAVTAARNIRLTPSTLAAAKLLPGCTSSPVLK